ncbi:hypothetical protein Tco_0548368 [Tanacetum coccineum]
MDEEPKQKRRKSAGKDIGRHNCKLFRNDRRSPKRVSDLESKVNNATDRLEMNRGTMSDITNEIAQTNRQIEQTRIQVESRDAMLLMLEKWLKKSKKEKLEVTSCLDCASSRHYPVDVELLS